MRYDSTSFAPPGFFDLAAAKKPSVGASSAEGMLGSIVGNEKKSMSSCLFFGTSADNPYLLQPQLGDALRQEGRPSQQGLKQHHLKVRPGQGHRNTGQPSPGSDIHHGGTRRQQLAQDRTVEHVPFPEALHLTRTDQATQHTLASQQPDVSLSQRETFPKNGLSLRRSLRYQDRFPGHFAAAGGLTGFT